MTTLLKGARVVDVFTKELIYANVLIEDGKIIGVGEYASADEIVDVSGKILAPGFIDGHIHIESTMLTPYQFSKIALVHGTTSIVTDPHEITNVCGSNGFRYMLSNSNGLPLDVFFMLPSCVPATKFDESKEEWTPLQMTEEILNKRVLGLAEMMNFVGVINKDETVMDKIEFCKKHNKLIDGHAPLLKGESLDKYIKAGINSDHECTNVLEAKEKMSKGQWIMIRNGTASKDLNALIDLFDDKYEARCCLVTDDRDPADLINEGHIDAIIREAKNKGKNPINAIKMASLNACTCFGIKYRGAIAPGYIADINVIDNLDDLNVLDVYKNGNLVVKNKKLVADYDKPFTSESIYKAVTNTINVAEMNTDYLTVKKEDKLARVIEIIPRTLLTNELHEKLDFSSNNGINVDKDILKIAVIERHNKTGHIGVGYIKGLGLKAGAIASTVSHDSHNIIVVGTNDKDMYLAINEIINIKGGRTVVKNGEILGSLSLPIGGLMADRGVEEVAKECAKIKEEAHNLGVPSDVAPFMNMAFVSLSVIPHLRITTHGYVDCNKFKLVSLFVEE